MRVFVLVLFLLVPILAHATQTCDRGYYKPSGGYCRTCLSGYYCPDDNSDDAIPCPADNTKWNKLLEECGYHPLEEIKSQSLSSWADGDPAVYEHSTDHLLNPAYDISHCYSTGAGFLYLIALKEGDWAISQRYNSARGDYWNGCDHLFHFYYANDGYYLSKYNDTTESFEMDWYNAIKPCTNAPENAHYTGPGTPDDPVESGGKTDYNDCPWACDDGYTLQDGECVAAFCPAGYYKPSPDSECTACPNGYYCPGDDKSDDAIPCPADNTDWNTLLEGCGYHPLEKIQTYLSSWYSNMLNDAYDISHCHAKNAGVELQEGSWYIELRYDSQRGDYWHGCDGLKYFYSANAGYYLSTYNYTSSKNWYNYIKPCTNAPENAHYTGPGTPDAIDGSFSDKNDCPWECDDGYGRHEDACMPLCRAGATKFHAGDYVFNIYKDKLTTPAINIELGNGTVCYVPLVEGSGKGALNVDYKGTVYHTSD